MDILLLNDDGPAAGGLIALREHLTDAGHRVVAFVPGADRSGCGCAASFNVALTVRRRHDWLYEVDGLPVNCAALGLEWFKAAYGLLPELCICGINEGLNFGACVPFSGTVAGATLAAWKGVRSIAVSSAGDASMALPVLDATLVHMGSCTLPAGACLNVNVATRCPSSFELDLPLARSDIPFVVDMTVGGTARMLPCRPDFRAEFELMLGLVEWQTGLEPSRRYERELRRLGKLLVHTAAG